MNGLKTVFIRHFEKNIVRYIICIVLFGIGITIGILAAVRCDAKIVQAVSEDIRSVCINISENGFNSSEILHTSFFKNVRNCFLIFIGGFSVFLLPLAFAVIAVYGFSYGFTAGFLSLNLGIDGFIMWFSSVFLNLIITVPVYIMMTVLSLNRAISTIGERKKTDSGVAYLLCFCALFAMLIPIILADAFIMPEFVGEIK